MAVISIRLGQREKSSRIFETKRGGLRDFLEGEAPAEPEPDAGRRPPEARIMHASGGRRAKARFRLGGSF
jgi:hypothetical protein